MEGTNAPLLAKPHKLGRFYIFSFNLHMKKIKLGMFKWPGQSDLGDMWCNPCSNPHPKLNEPFPLHCSRRHGNSRKTTAPCSMWLHKVFSFYSSVHHHLVQKESFCFSLSCLSSAWKNSFALGLKQCCWLISHRKQWKIGISFFWSLPMSKSKLFLQ